MKRKKVIIGSRKSKLALWQANYIAERLTGEYPELEVVIEKMVTTGDKILDVPLAKIGGKGLFTKELEQAMLEQQIDLAVHSLKDMPTQLPEGLTLAAITHRVDAGDALVSKDYDSLDALPQGAKVGTSSLRRKAQLLQYRPDLSIHDLRGNVDTRLRKLDEGEFDAIVLAAAGLKRLGWEARISEILPPAICLPAVGQGALAIEARAEDTEILELLSFLNDENTRWAAEAERAYLHKVEGGCQIPIGVYGQVEGTTLKLEAAILSVDGSRQVRKTISGSVLEAAKLGEGLAEDMLAAGGREILQEIMI